MDLAGPPTPFKTLSALHFQGLTSRGFKAVARHALGGLSIAKDKGATMYEGELRLCSVEDLCGSRNSEWSLPAVMSD
jgi:hypothetical protein